VNRWAALPSWKSSVREGCISFCLSAIALSKHLSFSSIRSDTFGRDANHTARVAGLFAQAASLVAPFAADRAAELRERAERAYAYARSQSADPETLIYSASELYRLTRKEEYREAFVAAWDALDIAYPPRRYGMIQRLAPNQFDLDDYHP
jgi:hypothetical protein